MTHDAQITHCECNDAADPFDAGEIDAELAAALLLEWGYVPNPPPEAVCKGCRLPIHNEGQQ